MIRKFSVFILLLASPYAVLSQNSNVPSDSRQEDPYWVERAKWADKSEELWNIQEANPTEENKKAYEDAQRKWGEAEGAYREHEAQRLHEAWLHAPDSKAKSELESELVSNAIRAGHDDIVDEVAAGGPFKYTEIVLSSESTKINIRVIRSFDDLTSRTIGAEYFQVPSIYNQAPVIRRINKDRFELWTEKHGWLFDSKGSLANEAAIPRKDGHGQGWFGAFLPDGRWITTDLWDFDRTIHFFTREGKWRKEVKVGLVIWARGDVKGKGWVFDILNNFDSPQFWVGPTGEPAKIERAELWTRCNLRDVRALGYPVPDAVLSDDGKSWLEKEGMGGHGTFAGHSSYKFNGKTVIRRNQYNIGFWPGSKNVFIGEHGRTFLYDENGGFRGWLAADYLADSSDSSSILVQSRDGRVASLGNDYKIGSPEVFVEQESAPATPIRLFDDLALGFFILKDHLVLASYKAGE